MEARERRGVRDVMALAQDQVTAFEVSCSLLKNMTKPLEKCLPKDSIMFIESESG